MTLLSISSSIIPGQSGYTRSGAIAQAWHSGQCSRAWGTGSRVTSVQLSKAAGGGIWKSWERMPDLTTELLDALEHVGVDHPSSFADCYHQIAPRTLLLKHTINAGMFGWWSGGPWSEALHVGEHPGTWYRYDLVSAYRWAATLGLPDTRSLRACVVSNPEDIDGLWIATIIPRPDLPFAFRTHKPVVISSEEIREYGVKATVIRGVRWDTTTASNYVEQTLTRLPCAKQSGRAYWGRWVCRDALRNFTAAKTWDLPNRVANFVWGWLIVGRVRLRVWLASRAAAHVYVDEVLTQEPLPTGTNIGDWHLKEQYDNGVVVKRTGWYFGRDSAKPTMRTGVSAA